MALTKEKDTTIGMNFMFILCLSDRASWQASYKTTNQLHEISETSFCHKTLHVSGIFCANHQELSTLHTAIGMFLGSGHITCMKHTICRVYRR
jgi:hypothetical protein